MTGGGRAAGSGDRRGMLMAVRRTLVSSLGFATVFCLAYLAAGPALVDVLTGIPAVMRLWFHRLVARGATLPAAAVS